MNKELADLLSKMYQFGTDHDSKTRNHSDQMLNITSDTGAFLSMIIQAMGATRILEIGTSDGYSTLWIADALQRTNGRVTTIEASEKKAGMASYNFELSGLDRFIDQHLGDVREFIKDQSNESFDIIFLDAERPQYTSYWPELDRVLRKGGLLIVDNAVSPKPEELIDLFKLINESERYQSQIIQIGKGEMVALKQRNKMS